MADRKLPPNYDEILFVDGFLHNRAINEVSLNYGYSGTMFPSLVNGL